jgi:hypothetical protein
MLLPVVPDGPDRDDITTAGRRHGERMGDKSGRAAPLREANHSSVLAGGLVLFPMAGLRAGAAGRPRRQKRPSHNYHQPLHISPAS